MEMLLHFARMILLSLHTAESQEYIKSQPKMEEILAPLGTDVTIHCNLPAWLYDSNVPVPWYMEQRDQSLRRIYISASYSEPRGKYSSPSSNIPYGSLIISNVQRNDSGVYFCTTPNYLYFGILQRTRLIVTNTSRPTVSVLVPSVLPEDQLNHSIPLLCFIFDPNPAWENVSWDIDGETSQVLKDVDTVDENGVFSIWSLKLVPAKTWTQRTADGCSVQHSRTDSAGVSTNTGNCNHVLYFGVPCVAILLAILFFILHFRKHLARGKVEQPANQVQMREIPQCYSSEDACHSCGRNVRKENTKTTVTQPG